MEIQMKRISLTTIALLMSMIGTANADTTSWFDKMYEGTWMTEYDSEFAKFQNYIDFDEESYEGSAYNFPAKGCDPEIEAYNQSNGYWG